MGKSQSKDGVDPVPLDGEDDGKEYFFPDGSKSKYPFEERPFLRTLDGKVYVDNL